MSPKLSTRDFNSYEEYRDYVLDDRNREQKKVESNKEGVSGYSEDSENRKSVDCKPMNPIVLVFIAVVIATILCVVGYYAVSAIVHMIDAYVAGTGSGVIQ